MKMKMPRVDDRYDIHAIVKKRIPGSTEHIPVLYISDICHGRPTEAIDKAKCIALRCCNTIHGHDVRVEWSITDSIGAVLEIGEKRLVLS